MVIFNYYTQDGHLMKEDEVMWRICDSKGNLFEEASPIRFSHQTGYNHHYVSNEEQHTDLHLNPFSGNHLHYFSQELATAQLNELKQQTQ